ncbi:MAG TPA: ABC transporter permease subunit [Kofleriaceae bacterium]|jgi:NitT/TauT family transport system permease protein|nr:ABC transporter permease subunit [Kofleriaceae bacterium]
MATSAVSIKRALEALSPNRQIALPIYIGYTVASVAVFVAAWQLASGVIPSPGDVLAALATLWTERGLFDELATSFLLNLEAIAWTTAITLTLAYLTVVPAARPIVAAVSKLRFTGMVGWAFVFTLWARDGHQLKLWMLVFGMTPFFVTAMAAVVAELPRERFDHARTLGMSEWRVVWEVVIRGTADQALEMLRQSAAMGWMMLTMVEGLVRSEGGIGALMLNENKHLQLDAVFALILVVLVVGVVQDWVLAWLRRAMCPYAALTTERR